MALAGLRRACFLMQQAAAAAVATAAATTQATAAGHARCSVRAASSSSRTALQAAAQQAAMAGYWRSILSSARAFGANRPAALLLGTAAVSAGVWAAQVRASAAVPTCLRACDVQLVHHCCAAGHMAGDTAALSPAIPAALMQQLPASPCRPSGAGSSSARYRQPAAQQSPAPCHMLAAAPLQLPRQPRLTATLGESCRLGLYRTRSSCNICCAAFNPVVMLALHAQAAACATAASGTTAQP